MADEPAEKVEPKEEVIYTKPTSQLDLEERLARNNESPLSVVQAQNSQSPFGVEEGAYVNVDPIYQNYANDTEKPLEAEEGVEKDALDVFKDAVAVDEDDDRSGDQKPSGAYVDSEDPRLGAQSEPQSSAAPFGAESSSGESQESDNDENENK